MTLTAWNPDPAPFGNAAGLDYVAADVAATIARSFGATVTVGEPPADLAERGQRRWAGALLDEPHEPAPVLSVARGAVTAYMSGSCTISGYTDHDWRAHIGPETLVIDTRTVPDDRIAEYAVRGPMVNPDLPSGMVSGLAIPAGPLADLADAWLSPYGGLAATLAG